MRGGGVGCGVGVEGQGFGASGLLGVGFPAVGRCGKPRAMAWENLGHRLFRTCTGGDDMTEVMPYSLGSCHGGGGGGW